VNIFEIMLLPFILANNARGHTIDDFKDVILYVFFVFAVGSPAIKISCDFPPETDRNKLDLKARPELASGKRKMSSGPWRYSRPQYSPRAFNSPTAVRYSGHLLS
jgi:hypothetical protein